MTRAVAATDQLERFAFERPNLIAFRTVERGPSARILELPFGNRFGQLPSLPSCHPLRGGGMSGSWRGRLPWQLDGSWVEVAVKPD
jgi:hypothetical protein